jgi:hypothetical protein
MKPSLAIALLNRFVPDGEPLAGDLIEECAAGRSRAWLWYQVIAAIVMASVRRSGDPRPLRLVDGRPGYEPRDGSAALARPRRVNLTASPLPGIGGLGLVVMATLVTVVMPQAWWLVVGAMAAGVVFGVVLIAIRRTRVG